MGKFSAFLLVLVMHVCLGEECIPFPSTWKISLISYEEATVSIIWQTANTFCTGRVIISQAMDKEETISPPVKVSKGQAMIKLEDKCKLYTIRMAALLPGRNELVYSSSKLVWLPSMLSSISALSNMAILYIPMDCPMPSMMVTACSSIMDTHCVSSPVASYSETYLSGLSSCSMYTFSLAIHNTTIWSIQSSTAVNLQLALSLSSTSATISTFYNTNCDISTTSWTLSFCSINNIAHGEDAQDGQHGLDSHSHHDQDRLHGQDGADITDKCSLIQLHPGKLETMVKVDGLQPCTQYTFTLYTKHMVGDKKKVIKEEKAITDVTKCPVPAPKTSEDNLFFPSVSLAGRESHSDFISGPSASHLPHIITILVIITIIVLCILIIIKRSHNVLSGEFKLIIRKPLKQDVENLL